MSERVPDSDIERLVGAQRERFMHVGRAVSSDQRVYVLHSAECRARLVDLRECEFSRALDWGIDASRWRDAQDVPVILGIEQERLVPFGYPRPGA